MTVKHILNIQELCIENKINQRYITIVNPKYFVPKHLTKVQNKVLGIIKDTGLDDLWLSEFTAKSRV